MKKFRKYLLALLALIVVAVGAAYFLAKKYEPDVRDLLVREVNKHLAAPVQVGDINLSLLSRFPDAALRFSEVVIPETNGAKTDTLLYIKDLYLQIGLFDFLRKNYKVSAAEINTGFYRMKFHPDGTDNFRFWNSGSAGEQAGDGGAHIELEDIECVDFSYDLHTAEGLDLGVYIRNATARGDFGRDQYQLDTRSKLRVDRVVYRGDTLYRDLNFAGPLRVDIDRLTSRYGFEGDGVELADQDFAIVGYMDDSEPTPQWHMEFRTEGADVARLVQLVPAWLRSDFSQYAARGHTNLDLIIDSGEKFELDATFDRLSGGFRHVEAMGRAKVREGAGSLRLRDGRTSLYIDHLEGEIGPGSVAARGEIVDFSAPTFDLHLKGDIDLSELKDLLNITRAEVLAGRVKLDGHLTGHLPRSQGEDDKLKLLRGMDFSGSMALIDADFKAVGRSERLTEINGDIELKNNAVSVKNAGGSINGSPFNIEGVIENALPYLSESGQRIHIAADFSAPRLDLNEIWNTEESTRDTSYRFSLPKDVSFNLVASVDQIEFRKFSARDVRGRAYYKNGVLSLNPVSFRLADGMVDASLTVSETSGAFRAQATATAQQLQIDQVFEAFENFGQTVVKADNISGRAALDIDFNAGFGSDLQVDLNSVRARTDLSVTDGRLKNLESLRQISDYIRDNGLWNALIRVDALEENLRTVSFDDLKNSIVIADRTVTIPEMKLGNSALSLDVMGSHGFDNTMDYSLSFRLNELLRTGKKNESEFGYVVDDGTGLRLFMRMYGNAESPEFALDKGAARDNRKENLEAEKTQIKNILKEEFGLFKKDTTLTGVEEAPVKSGTKFEVEWDGGVPNENEKDGAKPKTRSGKKPGKKKPKLSDEDRRLYEELEGDDDL